MCDAKQGLDSNMRFQIKDHYFKKAKKDNYLARSAYKLEEIDKKFSILKPGQHVLDLGYYPGSWIQYTARKIGTSGQILGVDLKGVNPKLGSLKNVELIGSPIEEIPPEVISNKGPFDIVLSDMAPNTCGIKMVDQARSMNLTEMVFSTLRDVLSNGGSVVIKVFDCHECRDFFKEIKDDFDKITFFRPKSTRDTSKEVFVICSGFKL